MSNLTPAPNVETASVDVETEVAAKPKKTKSKAVTATKIEPVLDDKLAWASLLSWAGVRSLGRAMSDHDFAAQSRAWIDEWLLDRIAANTLREMGIDEAPAWQAVVAIKALVTQQQWHLADVPAKKRAYRIAEQLFSDPDVKQLLNVNEYQGVTYFNKEAFEKLLWWLLAVAVVDLTAESDADSVDVPDAIVAAYDVIKALQDAEEQSGFQVDKLKTALIL